MLDIQYIRDNQEKVTAKSKAKGYPVDIKALMAIDDRRRSLQQEIDNLRRERNSLAESLKSKRPSDEEQAKGRKLKEDLAKLEDEFRAVEVDYLATLRIVPNMPLDDVPEGDSEDDNIVFKTVGELPKFDFEPKAHHEIGEPRGLIDKTRAAKISGSRFVYLLGDLVKLQFAIINFVIDELTNQEVIAKIIKDNKLELNSKPFTPILPPAMLKTAPYQASSRLNAEEVTYKIEQDDLWLNASAEHTLCTMHMDEIIPLDQLPLRYLGYSTSFRREAGTYGKDVEGILRLHQFDKIELESITTAETGLAEHHLMIALQEYLICKLGLPYQLLKKCTADIGKPNAGGVDMNVWFPAQKAYRETHTADYITDYQTRDLKIRTRLGDGSIQLLHTNDATAFALGRTMAAIMENFQTEDGKFIVPEVLRGYMGGQAQI